MSSKISKGALRDDDLLLRKLLSRLYANYKLRYQRSSSSNVVSRQSLLENCRLFSSGRPFKVPLNLRKVPPAADQVIKKRKPLPLEI